MVVFSCFNHSSVALLLCLQSGLRPRLGHAWEGSSLFRGRLSSDATPGLAIPLALLQVLQLVWAHRWHLRLRCRVRAQVGHRYCSRSHCILLCWYALSSIAGLLAMALQLVWARCWRLGLCSHLLGSNAAALLLAMACQLVWAHR